MHKKNALSEAEKLRIAELCENTDLSSGAIADTLGCSGRTIRRYKNYPGKGSVDHLEDTGSEDQPSMSEPTKKGRSYNFKKHRWEYKTPGSTVKPEKELGKRDKLLDCNEETLSEDDHVEEHETITFVGGKKFKDKRPEKEESEEEEFECECLECGGLFNGERERCPHCGTELDLDAYEEQTEDNEETTSREDQEGSEEDNEDEDEFDYECPHCGGEFDYEDIDWFLSTTYCPHCGKGIEVDEE